MKREAISQALNLLEERHISDTASFDPGAVQEPPERIVPLKKKRIITLALAALAIWLLVDSAVEFTQDTRDDIPATEP